MPNVYGELAIEWVTPFVVLLLGMAVLPLVAAHWWERNLNKLGFALACGLPAAIYMWIYASEHGIPFTLHDHPVIATVHEYFAFLSLLFALFVIAGGIHVRGTLAGIPI